MKRKVHLLAIVAVVAVAGIASYELFSVSSSSIKTSGQGERVSIGNGEYVTIIGRCEPVEGYREYLGIKDDCAAN